MHQQIADEILSMAMKDQELRFRVEKPKDNQALWQQITDIDRQSSRLMKRVVREIGWPTISKVGTKASQAAWLLVQHSPDLAFQKQCLNLMRRVGEGDVNRGNIAYLTDRVRMREGQPQVYGTQFVQSKENPNMWEPYQIEDQKNMPRLREAMALNTIEENMAEINNIGSTGTKQSGLMD